MPLYKISLKPGVNRENTRYTTEGGWYASDKIRFRQGTPEKIGGWNPISANTYLGLCRSLWSWTTLNGAPMLGIGTERKFYIEQSGAYYDITPIRTTTLLGTDPFTISIANGSLVTVNAPVHEAAVGDAVIFSGASAVGAIPADQLNAEHTIVSTPDQNTFTFFVATAATTNTTGGGSAVYASYQLRLGSAVTLPPAGWGGSGWGGSSWGGTNVSYDDVLRLWSQYNFGQDLVIGLKQGRMYYWNVTTAPVLAVPTSVVISLASPAVVTLTSSTDTPLPDGTALMFETTGALPAPLIPYTVYYVKYLTDTTFNVSSTFGGTAIDTTTGGSGIHTLSRRAVPVDSLAGASDVPLKQYAIIVSDSSRFTFALGSNDVGSTIYDPMLVRWSAQESLTNWTPAATNQAGSIRLSHGSLIVGAVQSRQEILVWTDSALYSLQYLGPPFVWGTQLLSDTISIASLNAMSFADGTAYWMGTDKFYKYGGAVQTLRCDLRQYVFGDINKTQYSQVFSGTNEGFNEIWWFYCSASSTTVDRYVVYNYGEDIWYYGNMARTAWLDTSRRKFPVAATYNSNIVNHEDGVDNNENGTPVALSSFIESAQFDIGDGHNFSFIYRVLPDLTFRGSTEGTNPEVTMYLQPLKNSGSGYTNPPSVGGTDVNASAVVASAVPVSVDEFTGQVYIRARGRQMSMRLVSNRIGTQWQLGSPRIDIRPDGRRG